MMYCSDGEYCTVEFYIVFTDCHRFQPSVEDKEMYKRFAKDKSMLQSTDQFLVKVGQSSVT